MKKVSIVIPIYNEGAGVEQLYAELISVVGQMPYFFELVLVDDGSSDDSAWRIRALPEQSENTQVVAIELVRNFGKEIALSAGLHACTGDGAITMDADLQHPPQYIPHFIDAWESGSSMVVGTRAKTESRNLFRWLATKVFYAIINYASAVKISPDIMDFRLLDREVIDYFNQFKERNRITRGLIDWLGYPHTLIPVAIPDRAQGSSSYSMRMLVRLAKDSLVSMSLLPLRISGYLGIAIVTVFGPLGIAVLIDQSLLGDNFQVSGAGSLGILTAFLIGIVLVNLGLVALYIANMHDQILGRPLYVSRKRRVHTQTRAQKQTASKKTIVATQLDARYKPQVPPSVPAPELHALTALFNQFPAKQTTSGDLLEKRHAYNGVNKLLGIGGTGSKRILWLSWKDIDHPLSGGAELVSTEIRERLAADGHQVTLLTSSFQGAKREEVVNGVHIVRMGGRYTVHLQCMLYFLRNRSQLHADVAIDEVNTAPFFFSWYSRIPTILFFHQLAREIWFHEAPKIISGVGYGMESIYVKLLSRGRALTVSRSSRLDLLRHGFSKENISIISEGIRIKPLDNPLTPTKFNQPTVLSLGAVRSMKQTLDQIRAFELAKSSVPNLRLVIAGDMTGDYAQKVQRAVDQSEYKHDILVHGRVSEAEKIELMQRAHWLLVTSIKEGWCLVVTEAASQGTPAIAYDADGLRDSVVDGATGFIVHPTPAAMAETIVSVFEHMNDLEHVAPDSEDLFSNADLAQNDPESTKRAIAHVDYQQMRYSAWKFAGTVTFERSYTDFRESLGL